MLENNTFTSEEFPYEIQIVAVNLMIPWAIDIDKEGNLYVTERIGRLWVIKNGEFLPEPLITFQPPFISQGESGLMGIVLDPDYEENHYIYAMHSYLENGRIYNRVVRLLEEDNRATIDRVLIDRIPGGSIHNGGRIKIGPDDKLYITTGDSRVSSLAQDINSLGGKLLRIDLNGEIPEDNPFPNSPVYSYGHRDPQGLAWGENGILYAAEHGQTAHDEINIIQPGANYGWPIVQGDEISNQINTVPPLIQSGNVTWAPSGIAYISYGIWQGRLLVAALRGERLITIELNKEGTKAVQAKSWLDNQYGRLREVVQAEDGTIYLTTSNRDGRGNPEANDDRIIRLIPKGSGS